MINDDYIHLIEKLHKRTQNGEVNWKSTARVNEFMVYFKDFSLSVASRFDTNEDEDIVSITLRNDSGTEIDRFWITPQDVSLYHTASEMHSGARRKALQIDDALSVIMSELESDEVVGLPDDPRNAFDDDIPF